MQVPTAFTKTVGKRLKAAPKQTICYCDQIDCFAAKESPVKTGVYFCTCLSDNDFDGEPCPFFKTKDEQTESLKKAEKRRIALAQKKNIRTISGVMFQKEEN